MEVPSTRGRPHLAGALYGAAFTIVRSLKCLRRSGAKSDLVVCFCGRGNAAVMRVVIVVGVASQPLSTYDALFFRKSNPRVR